MKRARKTLLIAFSILLISGYASALDINSSTSLNYYNSGVLDFQVDTSGQINAQNNLNMNGNSITSFFGSQCASGNVVVHVNDDGTLDCVDATGEVQSDFVNRAGDTMTGTLDMQSNIIQNVGNLGVGVSPSVGEIHISGSGGDSSAPGIFIQDPTANTDYGAKFVYNDTNVNELSLIVRNNGVDTVGLGIDRNNANVRIPNGNLDITGNSIVNHYGSQCSSGQVMVDVNDNGNFDCVDATGEVQGDFVARSGDTMTGTLDMQSNTIINVGSGNIDIGDGSGDINMNGNRIYGSSIGHFQEGGISGTLSNTQNNLDTLSANSFYVAGDVKVGGDFIGSGGDVAEIVNTEDDRNLEPGTVVTISGDIEVEASKEAYDTAVAGIVSTDPGVKLAQHRDGVPLALTGIVPVKVTVENGAIQHGDLLTTSDKEGYAMKCSNASNCQGAIIGKAMGSLEENGKVETLVTLG